MSSAVLPHAVIVTGSTGEDLSEYYRLHSQANDNILEIAEHPNTSKTNLGIYIEDIRELQHTVRTHKASVRTVVRIYDAAAMTVQSQNALLKLLEEPRPGLYLILETYTPDSLLATIRSRCQTVRVKSSMEVDLPADKAARIRFMSGGSSGEAARLARDTRYFEQRSRAFELAKRYVAGTAYERLVVIKDTSETRTDALQFLDACSVMYTALLRTRYSNKIRDEAAGLLRAEEAIRQNGNTKLQLLRTMI